MPTGPPQGHARAERGWQIGHRRGVGLVALAMSGPYSGLSFTVVPFLDSTLDPRHFLDA